MKLPPLNGTPFAEAEVKNEVKSVQNLRNQATKSNTPLSLLSFLHYSEHIKLRRFPTRVSSILICRLLGQWFNIEIGPDTPSSPIISKSNCWNSVIIHPSPVSYSLI